MVKLKPLHQHAARGQTPTHEVVEFARVQVRRTCEPNGANLDLNEVVAARTSQQPVAPVFQHDRRAPMIEDAAVDMAEPFASCREMSGGEFDDLDSVEAKTLDHTRGLARATANDHRVV